MSQPTEPAIELKPFTAMQADTLSLARVLSGVVMRNSERLRVDFPRVIRRYRSVGEAQETIDSVIHRMQSSNGLFGAYVLTIYGRECGVFSYQCGTLKRHILLVHTTKLAAGPLIAGWIDAAGRLDESRGILPTILRMGAGILGTQRNLTGYAYAFVRTDHPYMHHVLTDERVTAPFGGFKPKGKPRSYESVDGVAAKRQLYVAGREMSEMRVG